MLNKIIYLLMYLNAISSLLIIRMIHFSYQMKMFLCFWKGMI